MVEKESDDDLESTTINECHTHTVLTSKVSHKKKLVGKSLVLDKTDCAAINCRSGSLTPVATTPSAHHSLTAIAGLVVIDRTNDGAPGDGRYSPGTGLVKHEEVVENHGDSD